LRIVLKYFFLVAFFLGAQTAYSQRKANSNKKVHFQFVKNNQDFYGLDSPGNNAWSNHYDTLINDRKEKILIAVKSLPNNTSGIIDVRIENYRYFIQDSVRFLLSNTSKRIRYRRINDSTLTINLPANDDDYNVDVYYKSKKINSLQVKIYKEVNEKVVVVPLLPMNEWGDSLKVGLNTIFRQANLSLDIQIKPEFKLKDKERFLLFDNPLTTDQYTRQMRELRDLYFETFSAADKKSFYVFIIPGFVNSNLNSFCVKSKGLSFATFDTTSFFVRNTANVLAKSIGYLKDSWENKGPKRGTTNNLLDDGRGLELTHFQWQDLRHNAHSFSYFDNYEDVRTNNGLVAYYFWQEDVDGNIRLIENQYLSSIKRPYKKNYVSYHLDINEFLFMPRLKVFNYLICYWHLIAFGIISITSFLIRFKLFQRIKNHIRKVAFWKVILRMIFFTISLILCSIAFDLINAGYERFEVRTGYLKYLGKLNTNQAIQTILYNQNLKQRTQSNLKSEILIRKEDGWHVKKRKRVLYFDAIQDTNGVVQSFRLSGDSDSLLINAIDYRKKAISHYMVVNEKDQEGKLIRQRIFNHVGVELTEKMTIEDPPKRILVFVNGYRPTSVGHSFEDNFEDIRNNGLEYPNSSNIIYTFDRYDYWRPWNEMDLQFQKRINPTDTYYADGHFSVSSSNHQSLLNFTTIAAVYPKRCKKGKHTCYSTKMTSSGFFGVKEMKTIDLHRMEPNWEGFKKRVNNGRIAGKNLLQVFNEIPNRSENDTIYFVAHSMGYAYALGIIRELRGKIQFGGFYIMAPENASCGKVLLDEWKEVWQYGSNFNKKGGDAPCLIDGVAPQVMAGGLKEDNRRYIPIEMYEEKGFYDSHFIGYYSWIFDIPKGQKGNITQR
jgi:hypothetical protein